MILFTMSNSGSLQPPVTYKPWRKIVRKNLALWIITTISLLFVSIIVVVLPSCEQCSMDGSQQRIKDGVKFAIALLIFAFFIIELVLVSIASKKHNK